MGRRHCGVDDPPSPPWVVACGLTTLLPADLPAVSYFNDHPAAEGKMRKKQNEESGEPGEQESSGTGRRRRVAAAADPEKLLQKLLQQLLAAAR